MIKKFLGKALLIVLIGGLVYWLGSDEQAVPTVVNGISGLFAWSGDVIKGLADGLSGLGNQEGTR